MTTKLRIADGFSLPVDVVTQSIAVVAKRRAGKSYLARKFVEELHRCGQQVVVLDPKGDAWGVRYAADGKGPGLPIIIVGGERADVPLEPGGGEVVARLVVEERVSVLIDLSLLRKHEVATFCAIFLEALYRLKATEKNRTPCMLVVDEADAIAPQKPQPNEARMLGAAEDIVRRGGQRGLGVTLITQRTAVLNKNVLTQAQVLVALRTIAPQDLKAMGAWIDVHGEPEQRSTLMASLPALPVGDAWVWSPGWPTTEGIFQRVHVARISTFDSGATPKPGERRVEPRDPARVDLDAVRNQMAETIERAKADDPKELRKRIAELERQVRDKPAPAAPTVERVEVPVFEKGEVERVEAAIRSLQDTAQSAAETFNAVLEDAAGLARKVREGKASATPPPQARAPRSSNGHAGDLPKGEVAVLTAAAQCGDEGASREQLSILTGYKRSTRDAYVQRARERGYLVEVRGGNIAATPEGIAALGPSFETLPTGDALLQHWLGRLPEGERKVLEVVCDGYPGAVSRDEISERTEYKRSTRDAYIQRLSTRKLVDTDSSGVTAREELFS